MRVLAAYIGVVMIWSTTPLAIVWGAADNWFYGAALRIIIAAILCLPIILFWYLRKSNFRLDLKALRVYSFGAIPITLGMGTMYWAAQYLESAWVAIIFALNPLLTGILAHFTLANHALTWPKLAAILLSLFGLTIMFLPKLHLDHSEIMVIAIIVGLGAVFFHALGTVLVKKCSDNIPSHHIVVSALWISAIVFTLIQPNVILDLNAWKSLTSKTQYAILYAASAGSIIGFLLFFYLLKHVDAVKVSLIPVITPVFALTIAHLLNDEDIGAEMIIGGGIILLGLLWFQFSKKKPEIYN
jgi:drug/metabolite transporter (DMT)-like permease